MFKKTIAYTAAAAILLGMTACGENGSQQETAESSVTESKNDAVTGEQLSIVCTIFPADASAFDGVENFSEITVKGVFGTFQSYGVDFCCLDQTEPIYESKTEG